MFIRIKNTRDYRYLQIVESKREGPRVKQRVLATLGQLDYLTPSGKLDDLARSLLKFTQTLKVIDVQKGGSLRARRTPIIGPALIFERLWHQLDINSVLTTFLRNRRFRFRVERTVFLTVLHRLFDRGSDRAAEKWKEDFRIEGLAISSQVPKHFSGTCTVSPAC